MRIEVPEVQFEFKFNEFPNIFLSYSTLLHFEPRLKLNYRPRYIDSYIV